MAKNFIQDGKTIPLTNSGQTDIPGGAPVAVGSVVVVAIATIQPGETGDGFTEGVFLLPKLPADAITAGTRVFLKDGVVQLDEADAIAAGVAWEVAAAATTVIEVKINA
ncbi:DUF2190 family protein [Kosakonia quasisacchari]|uniref:DUF2190 family protein n=1 Tax=Kosakonia quasisacchari TaxID=2529380 RepID=UPI0039DF7086